MSLRLSLGMSLPKLGGIFAAVMCAFVWASPALSFSIELKDVASDRIDRQRAHGYGDVPLPGTPDVTRLDERLALKGLTLGSPIYIRIYKEESELELWMLKGDRFVLLDTYPICHWSGTLGPKLKEGDAQAPEGVYTVTERQIRLRGRWQRAFNLGFPNPLDQIHSRTGSFILIHGGCSSVGCFAMTNAVIEEIYKLANAALSRQQERFHVHVFPFRMTAANMARHQDSEWRDFWANLKEVQDVFDRTHRLPRIGICEQRYLVDDGRPGEFGNENAYRVYSRCTTNLIAQGPAASDDAPSAGADDAAQPSAGVLSSTAQKGGVLAPKADAAGPAVVPAVQVAPIPTAAGFPSPNAPQPKLSVPAPAPVPPPAVKRSSTPSPKAGRPVPRTAERPSRPPPTRVVPRAKGPVAAQGQSDTGPRDANEMLGNERGT